MVVMVVDSKMVLDRTGVIGEREVRLVVIIRRRRRWWQWWGRGKTMGVEIEVFEVVWWRTVVGNRDIPGRVVEERRWLLHRLRQEALLRFPGSKSPHYILRRLCFASWNIIPSAPF